MMKHIITLLLLTCGSITAFAQFPNAPNKMRLGAQTTGDGLIFRTDSIPDWAPSSLNNAWLAIDTLTGNLYSYQGAEWRLEVAGDLRTVYPKVINKSGVNIKRGQAVMVDYNQVIQGDLIRILPADGSGTYAGILTMGIASTDIDNNAEGFITWFGYVREVKQSDIIETGDTVVIGDILYLSGTQLGKLTNVEPTAPKLRVTMALVVRKPNANNMTLLVRPSLNMDLGELNDVDLTGLNDGETIVYDSAGGKWIAGVATGGVIDTTVIATRAYVDGKVDSTRLVADSILVYYIGGVEVGRDTISGVGGSTTTTFTIETGQQLAFVVVDDNNATPWDGLSVIGVFFSAPANEATFTVNGVVQTLAFPVDSTNLSFSGSSSPITLNSSTGSDVRFINGNGITLTRAGDSMTISQALPIYAVLSLLTPQTLTFAAGSTTPDTIPNLFLSQLGGFFSMDGNGMKYTSSTTRYFLISVHASFKFAEANNVVTLQGWKTNGGTTISLGPTSEVESLIGNEVMQCSFTGITSLVNNDIIRFGFAPAAHTGDDDLEIKNVTITISEI